ncbi:putative ribonuclease H-like domain-containing protein [Tanacetum coccineum]
MRPFGCSLTILNTLILLGKFDGKIDDGYLLGYSTSSKAFRVYNKRTKRVEENLHINFLEDQPNVAGTGPNWIKDIQDSEDVIDKEGQHQMPEMKQVSMMNLRRWLSGIDCKAMNDVSRQAFEEEKRKIASQKKAAQATSANTLSTDRPSVSANADESSFVYLGGKIPIDASTLPNADLPIDPNMPDLEDASDTLPNDGIFNGAYDDDEDVGAVADFNSMDNTIVFKQEGRFKRLLQYNKPCSKLLKFEVHVEFPYGKRIIGTKWEEGIDYDEVFAPVARIESIRLFLAFASYMGFTVYQMDVKSTFLYGTIEEEVPRAWYETLSSFLIENGFRRGTIDKTLFIKKKKSDIMLVQVYVDDIIFGSTKKSMCIEFEECMHKRFQRVPLGELTFFWDYKSPHVMDEDGVDVDVHVYRSMIGSLMYLTASRPDIMFAVCACARFQVTPKASHLNAVKGFLESDYGGASLDIKSTTEYVAAANCCGQVLWIQNQMMDYGFNFMNTKIHIDNESTISVIKNPVSHSKTKHIEIRFHFIRDCYEKRLTEVIKIHIDSNVADLLTKGFDVTRFNFLVFWMTAKSRTINNTSYIDAIVAGKPVTILEASIRSDILFDDADGIDSLNNQAIFDNIQDSSNLMILSQELERESGLDDLREKVTWNG